MTATRVGSFREKIHSCGIIDDISSLEVGNEELRFMQQLGDQAFAPIIVMDKLNQKQLEEIIAGKLKDLMGRK